MDGIDAMSLLGAISDIRMVVLAALILALFTGGLPQGNNEVVIVSLLLMMTLSLQGVDFSKAGFAEERGPLTIALLCCFGIGTLSALAISLTAQGELRDGWVFIAAVPSAVSVIPATMILGGDVRGSAISSTVIYLTALVLTPLIIWAMIGSAIDPLRVLGYTLLFIALPFALSRPIRRVHIPFERRIILVNLSYFALILCAVGPNRDVLFTEPLMVIAIAILAAVRIFGIGWFMMWIGGRLGADHPELVSSTLFATWKNTGMAMAMAAAIVGGAAVLPPTVSVMIEMGWFIFLGGVWKPVHSHPYQP